MPNNEREISYLICALPRSGSSIVCDALGATELAGYPREYFLPEAVPNWRESMGLTADTSPLAYLEALRREKSTPNGVFGVKIMRSYFDGWLSGLRTGDPAETAPELLNRLFPGLRFVWMRRRDLVRQAISLVRAIQTGLWHTREPGQQAKMEPRFDFKEIDAKVKMLQRHDAEWAAFFAEGGLSPVEIVYEKFDADMAGCVRATLAALEIEAPEGNGFFRRPLALSRQSDAINEEWAVRYKAEK